MTSFKGSYATVLIMTRFMLALVSDLIILLLILCFLQNQGRGDCSKSLQNCVMYTNQSFEIMNKSLHKGSVEKIAFFDAGGLYALNRQQEVLNRILFIFSNL